MSQNKIKTQKLFIPLMLVGLATASKAQEIQRPQPKFWFGASAAANFNFYSGTTQRLNADAKAPTAFHKGFGIAPFGSVLMEYRPHPIWGFMLNVGYDDRSAKFENVDAPCDCPENLKTKLTYVTIQPSLRIAPFSNGFYLFLGGAYSYNLSKTFTYTQELQPDKSGEISDVKKGVFSSHVGVGYDIPLSSKSNRTQVNLSPFVSYHPYFGQEPRTVESWSLSTIRAGIAIKFGKVRATSDASSSAGVASPSAASIQFSVRPPITVQSKRRAKETFPLRDYVFFNESATEIPSRYVKLNKGEAEGFKETQFQEAAPKDAAGRSDRQLSVYHNILNILGDRMRKSPNTTITLTGSSAGKGAETGKVEAEAVKSYLVDVFGISPTRIITEGRDQPLYPSEQPGGKIDLVMLRDGDRRVDITSSSPELLAPLQIIAVQENPLDSRIILKAKTGSKEPLKSWTVDVIDEKGNAQHFGPYTKEQESLSVNGILGDRKEGNYKIVMIGIASDGTQIRKESSMHLIQNEEPKEEALRYSVLFDFNKSTTVASYEKFLTETVAPAIPANATVVIHGHSDIIGDPEYNSTLSMDRALETQRILKKAVSRTGKKGITYETFGLGDDEDFSPFQNKYPEERFYNRTVIVDIIPSGKVASK